MVGTVEGARRAVRVLVTGGAGQLGIDVVDHLRADEFGQAESLLATMDDVYAFLVTVDFPDGVTGGLRRTTDALRAVLERTRGDLTVTGAQERLRKALERAERSATKNVER